MIQITGATPNPIPAGQQITITTAGGPIDSVTITPLGGGLPINIKLMPPANTAVLGPFPAGNYQITVTDSAGASDSVMATAQ